MRTSRARGLVASIALAALVCAGCGSGSSSAESGDGLPCVPDPPPEVQDGLRTPDVRSSVDGVLETTLRASYGPVELNGRTYQTMSFEGSVPGPTLAVCPGDTLVVHFENDLGDTPASWLGGVSQEHAEHGGGQRTNLHTHGLNVSPKGHGDNVFLDFAPGEKFTYRYEIPKDHPPGMYWYHPHRHGYAEEQVYAGLYGVLYVAGGLDTLPALRHVPTRTMVISSFQLGRDAVVPVQKSDTEKSPYYVNGQLEPKLRIRPGEVQRWRILNADDNAIVDLGLAGQPMYVLATDGNTLEHPVRYDHLLIGPGERREVLVQGGPAGSYELESRDFAQFQDGDLPASTVATVVSSGEPVSATNPVDAQLVQPYEDLSTADVVSQHRVVFTEQERPDGSFAFLINGLTFDPTRVDASMPLGGVSEWTIENPTTEWHTFHIHVNDYQITDVKLATVPRVTNGTLADVNPEPGARLDTVKVPPGATVTMRTRPINFTGKFVFHCHMLFHEDNGMMGVAEVTKD